MSRRIWKRLLTKKYKNAYPCWPPAPPPPPPPSSLFFESFLCCETLESDPERLKDSAPSDMELRRRDDRFFFRLPPPLPRFPFPVGPSVADSPLVLIAGELGAFPSNSSKKSCNQSYTNYSGLSQPGASFTKNVGLNWYCLMKMFFSRKIPMFFEIEKYTLKVQIS